MRAFTGMVILALAGCSTASDVVQTGTDTYKVRADAGGGSRTDAEIKALGIKRANEFCDAQGKRAVITIGQSSSWHVFSLQTAEVHFSCDDRPATRSPAKSSTP